jgi:hypothetical protein
MISRGWEAGVKALDRERGARSAALTSGRASATLLLSGECHAWVWITCPYQFPDRSRAWAGLLLDAM